MSGHTAVIGRLHVITDVTVQKRYTHEQLAALAATSGADVIQFRDKRMSEGARTETALRLTELCERFGVTLIVNDSIDTAVASGASGVHLGRRDDSITEARSVLGPRAIIGGSCGDVQQAIEAQEASADYIGFGHVYATGSKDKGSPPVGLDALHRVCEAVRIPVIAIGGIGAQHVRDVLEAGAHGVAVIAAVCAADDPAAATRRIREQMG